MGGSAEAQSRSASVDLDASSIPFAASGLLVAARVPRRLRLTGSCADLLELQGREADAVTTTMVASSASPLEVARWVTLGAQGLGAAAPRDGVATIERCASDANLAGRRAALLLPSQEASMPPRAPPPEWEPPPQGEAAASLKLHRLTAGLVPLRGERKRTGRDAKGAARAEERERRIDTVLPPPAGADEQRLKFERTLRAALTAAGYVPL